MGKMFQKTTALTKERPLGIQPGGDVRCLVADWHSALDLQVSAGELAATTAKTYKRGAGRFLTWCASWDVESVSGDTVRLWLAELLAVGYKPAACNTWLAGVRSLYRWAVATHRITHNPLKHVRGQKRTQGTRKHRRQPLTDAEVRRVLAIPDNLPIGLRNNALLHVLAYTGARTVEVHRANLADLHTEGGRLGTRIK